MQRIFEKATVPEPEKGDIPSSSKPFHTALSGIKHPKLPDCSWIFIRGTVKNIKEAAKEEAFSKSDYAVRLRELKPGDDNRQGKVSWIEMAVEVLVKDEMLKIGG